jgi:hypothetical protein
VLNITPLRAISSQRRATTAARMLFDSHLTHRKELSDLKPSKECYLGSNVHRVAKSLKAS